MRILKHDYLIIALAAPLLFIACADNDVYDPDKVRPVAPVENPLGDDFVAPDGFDWSMLATVKLNIEVKDKFNGQYKYLIEIFTRNPLSDATATPLAAGYAKSGTNYTTEISIPKSIEHLFIRQTDPKQRQTVYQYVPPKDGNMLNCQLYYPVSQTRTLNVPGKSGWDRISSLVKEYGEEQETSINKLAENPEFEPYSNNQLKNGAVYVIKSGDVFSGQLTNYNGKATVIVRGTWNMNSTPQGLDIYVTNGGQITGQPYMGDRCSLEIQKGGFINSQSFQTQTNIPVKNFGTFKVSGNISFNNGSSLYNDKDATLTTTANINFGQAQITVRNFGTLTAQNAKDINSGVIYNAENATFTIVQDVDATSTQILNHGVMQVGAFKTNSNLNSIIANYGTGTIIADKVIGGAIVINDNLFELNTFDCNNHTAATLYNNCTLIAKTSIVLGNLIMDSGSIIGKRISDKEWESAPTVRIINETTQELYNGSIIKAINFYTGNTCTIIGSKTEEASMIQAQKFIYTGTTHMKENLILDREKEYYNEEPVPSNNPWMVDKAATVVTTEYGTASNPINNCSGTVYPGNPGTIDPEDPPKTDTGDNTIYTYAFEDQWPAYGDFDMNDAIITIDKISTTNKDKQVSIQGHVRAVGASRKTGIGIQFLNVKSSGVTISGKVQSGNPIFEAGQNNPVVILCTNAHKFCKPNITDNDFAFYCTVPGDNSEGDGAEFEIKMMFPTAEEAAQAANIKNIDVFIITQDSHGSTGRTEIHMPHYAPTNLGATKLFGMGNDASEYNNMLKLPKKGYYLSTEGLAWSICIPYTEVWKWPKEYNPITNVYPKFKDWVINGGKAEDLNWISDHNNNIFVKP
nr:LruC domain-containing protein [Bacteroides intestinalis]